jgi:hypothetical protein
MAWSSAGRMHLQTSQPLRAMDGWMRNLEGGLELGTCGLRNPSTQITALLPRQSSDSSVPLRKHANTHCAQCRLKKSRVFWVKWQGALVCLRRAGRKVWRVARRSAHKQPHSARGCWQGDARALAKVG